MKKNVKLAILFIIVVPFSGCTKDQAYPKDDFSNELIALYDDMQTTIMSVLSMETINESTDAELKQMLSKNNIPLLSGLGAEKNSIVLSQSFNQMLCQINDNSKDITKTDIIIDDTFSNHEKRLLIMYLACYDLVFDAVTSISIYKSAGPCEDAYLESLENICENFILAGAAAVILINPTALAVATLLTYKGLDDAEEAYEECLENQ